MLGLVAWAQPGADETWLHVAARTPDGAPMCSAPTVKLSRMVGSTRMPLPTRGEVVGEMEVIVGGMVPGQYLLEVSLPAFGLADAPVTLDLRAGHTTYVWTVPDAISVALALTPPVPGTAMGVPTVYLKRVGGATASLVPARLAGETVAIGGIVGGEYEMLVLTDAGYGFATFTARGETRVDVPALPLQPYGAVRLTAVCNRQPGDGTGLYMAQTLRPGFTVTLHGNAGRDGVLLLTRVPPGAWATDVKSHIGHRRGSIVVKAGETATMTAEFPIVATPKAAAEI